MRIFDWVTSKTGVWGPAMLDFYFQNAGWINAIVVAYGILLLLSWQNLSRVSDSLVDQILDQAKEIGFNNAKGNNPKVVHLSDFKLSWDQAFASSKFPFIAKQTGFLIHRSSLENVRALIADRDLIQRSSRKLDKMGIQLERSS
jgi:hypothetical protein